MTPTEKKWDANAERDLCVAAIICAQDGERMRYNWPKVQSTMEALGYGFTKDAISQRFSKTIMKDFRARHGGAVSSTNGIPTTTSIKPRKRKTSTKKNKKSEEDDEDSSSDKKEEGASPEKKVKLGTEDETPVEAEKVRRQKRESSATAADSTAKFEEWVKKGEEDEA